MVLVMFLKVFEILPNGFGNVLEIFGDDVTILVMFPKVSKILPNGFSNVPKSFREAPKRFL